MNLSDDYEVAVFLVLLALSVFHTWFGKKIPRWAWILSFTSTILAGIWLGFISVPSPYKFLASLVFSLIFLGSNLIYRLIRSRHDI